MENKLKTIREFQLEYPTAHVGGSIGLMLRGISVGRDLKYSDIDMTIDEFNPNTDLVNGYNSSNDFDYIINSNDIKLDLRICPEPSFDIINFEGFDYNVSKLRDMLFWKQKYANKGVKKHEFDLQFIQIGKRPKEDIFPLLNNK
jgi:hypothetical protein